MLDLFNPPKPPKPKNVTFVRNDMRSPQDPDLRREQRLADMREYAQRVRDRKKATGTDSALVEAK